MEVCQMRTRLIALAVFALIGVTAFAPAPFMKSDHGKKRGGDVLSLLQGTWKIADKTRTMNGELMKYSTSQRIIIEKETWQFSTLRAPAGGGPGGGAAPKGKAK